MSTSLRSVSFPVDTPPEEKQESIELLQEWVSGDPETQEALNLLVYNLEHAFTEKSEDLAWSSFQDRIAHIISRAKNPVRS